MASSSRETPVNQHISGLTVTGGAKLLLTGGAKLFAGTANHHTTNNIYNGPFNLPLGGTEGNQSQTSSYYEVPNRRVSGFIGRDDVLQTIGEALSNGPGPRVAVLQGMVGQGKSQVALEYCHRKKDNPYSATFWVDATNEDMVKRSFQSISERIKVGTDYLPDISTRVAFVLRTLTSWTFRWLMVFDNYDNLDAFPNLQDFIPRSELGAILVTSRHPDSIALVGNQSNHFIELFGLEENAAVALLVQQSQISEGISADAKEIVGRLGCHPLAVTQAGAYIRKRRLRLCEFMGHYERREKIILEHTPQLSQYRKKLGNTEEETSLNVFTTWELSFQQLQSENSVVAKLLTLFAFFDEKDISEQLFAEFSANQEQISESAKLLVWLNAFSNTGGQWDSDLFADVLTRLRDSSLLQAFTRGLDGFYHSSLHPLIKDWIRLRTNESICQENIYMAATLVKEILVKSWQKQHFNLALLAKQTILSHIIALEESDEEYLISQAYITSNQKILDEYKISQFWFARFLLDAGSYHLAEIMNQRLNKQNEKILGLEHPDTLTSMANLASTSRNQGRWKEAEELDVQVMETSSRVLGLEHPDTLTSMANLASTYRNQGRWKEAEELEMAARGKKEKIVELLLRYTRVGLDSGFIGLIFLDAAREGNAKIVELFLKFTNIGREKISVLEIKPPIIPRRRDSFNLCIHEARSIARRHKATLAILDTWLLGFEKKQYMSLDALLIDERFGIIPDWFECDWEVQEVLQMNKEHEFSMAKVLRSLVVLTGGRSSFEATVCEKYLTDKWGRIGLDLLDSVAFGLDSADSDRDCTSTSAFIDRLSIQPNRISVLCKANLLPTEKRALLEALVWLCEAIRVPESSSKLGMSTSSCQVECSSLEFSTLQARDQAESAHACVLPTSLKLCFKLQALSHYLTLKDNCWLPLFESGVIAKRSRPEIPESEKEDCFHGLEVSFDLMIQLAGVEIPVLIDGGVILVGYQTALVPTRMAGTSVQWHLETASKSRLNPFELQSTRSNWVKETDWKAFKDLKCFIGWCRSAHINLGTSILTDQVRWSNEKSQKRTLRWSGISVGAQAVTSSPLQMGLVGQMTFTFVHNKIMFAPSTVFAKMLKDTSKEVAIVVDCSDRRAWLVPKLSLLLHMSHVWVRRHEIEPNPIPYANAHHVGGSVEQILRDCGDIALSGQGEDCLRLRQLLLGLNINLIESRQHTEGATRKKLFGFEFMDVVCEPPHGGLMKRALSKSGGSSWYGLSDLADAVVFCAGLGDAITAGKGGNGECIKCNTLPTNSYYLAASLSCLNELITRQGNVLACAQNGKITISKDHYWKISGNPFEDCTHDDNSSESCWYKTEIFQQVYQRSSLTLLKGNGQPWSSPNIPLEGAVVFGRISNQG